MRDSALRPTFKMIIEINVHGVTDGELVVPFVSDALTELINRRDFKNGALEQGRASTHSIDYNSKVVTVDLFRQFVGEVN